MDFGHLLHGDGDSAFDILDAFDPFQIDDVFSVAAEERFSIQLGVELIEGAQDQRLMPVEVETGVVVFGLHHSYIAQAHEPALFTVFNKHPVIRT